MAEEFRSGRSRRSFVVAPGFQRLEYRDDLRVRFLADNLIAAAASSNNPVLSPAAWKSAIDTGGASLLRGATKLARQKQSPPSPCGSSRP